MIRPQSYRPYPAPLTLWILAQSWRDVLFAHWRVSLPDLRRVVPEPLPLDTYEGDGWVSIVAFGIENFRMRGMPPVPKLSSFPEVNFRTYVTIDGKPGVYFFSLDVTSLPSVFGGRVFFYLPYFQAWMTMDKAENGVHFKSERKRKNHPASIDVEYGALGDAEAPTAGSLDYWLTERYCLYSVHRNRRVYRAEIDHAAWQLQPANATFNTNTIALAAGITLPDDPPLLHYAQRQDAKFWYPNRI